MTQKIIVITRVGVVDFSAAEFFAFQTLAADQSLSVAESIENSAIEFYARRKGIIVDFPS